MLVDRAWTGDGVLVVLRGVELHARELLGLGWSVRGGLHNCRPHALHCPFRVAAFDHR